MNRPSVIRALVVDDETVARSLLRELIAEEPGVEVIGEAANGNDAVDLIASAAPDLVFLDVQMPELDGFGVIERVGVERMPPVIFVTAYDQYALRAFGVHALDYLLKPLDPEKVRSTVRHALAHRRRAEADETAARLVSLLEHVRGRRDYAERLAVRGDGRIRMIDVSDIDWIEAADKSVVLHIGRTRLPMRTAISALERQLDPAAFRRVHRSSIVNVSRVVELQPWFHGDWVLILKDGTRVTSGAAYRSAIQDLVGT